jgi:hypothetical protein
VISNATAGSDKTSATPTATRTADRKERLVRLHRFLEGRRMGGYLGLALTPRSVGGEATDHPGRYAERDPPIADPVGPFVRDVVVEIGVDLVAAALSDRSGPDPARRTAPGAPPARPCARMSCRLRGDT